MYWESTKHQRAQGTACDFLELCILNCQILTSYSLDNCLIIISVKKKPLPPSSARCKKYAFVLELEKSFLWFQRDRSPVTPGHSQICKGKPRWKVKDAKVRGGARGRVILSCRRPFSPEGLRNTSRSLQDGSREVIWSELCQVNKTNAVLNQNMKLWYSFWNLVETTWTLWDEIWFFMEVSTSTTELLKGLNKTAYLGTRCSPEYI